MIGVFHKGRPELEWTKPQMSGRGKGGKKEGLDFLDVLYECHSLNVLIETKWCSMNMEAKTHQTFTTLHFSFNPIMRNKSTKTSDSKRESFNQYIFHNQYNNPLSVEKQHLFT